MLARGLADGVVAKQRFLREARAAAAVCHEHVVTIHAVDEVGGQPFIVMQLVTGHSLQEKLDRSGPLKLPEILRIGMEIALGLAAAHAQGLVHRDIKPGNILLENGSERVKITDFGLARAVDDASLTDSGTIAGTPNYMSPEQALGEPIERTTDLFSLGSVLYVMCTGVPPFRAESTVAVLRKVSDEAPPPIRELNPDVPEWLIAIISRLMAKAPAERIQSAAEVAEILAAHLAELKQPARPAPIPAAAPPFARPKSIRRIGALASVLGLAAAVIAILFWRGSWNRDGAPRNSEPIARQAELPSRPAPPPATPSHEVGKAVARDPVMSKTFYGLAAEAAKKGEQKRALELYSEALRRDPENTAALLRVRLRYRQPMPSRTGPAAIADTTEAIRLEPKNAEAF